MRRSVSTLTRTILTMVPALRPSCHFRSGRWELCIMVPAVTENWYSHPKQFREIAFNRKLDVELLNRPVIG